MIVKNDLLRGIRELKVFLGGVLFNSGIEIINYKGINVLLWCHFGIFPIAYSPNL
jgi:hypothetical protein